MPQVLGVRDGPEALPEPADLQLPAEQPGLAEDLAPLPHCPSGDALQRRKADELFECDACSDEISKGKRMFDCQRCDYSLCKRCYSAVAEIAQLPQLQYKQIDFLAHSGASVEVVIYDKIRDPRSMLRRSSTSARLMQFLAAHTQGAQSLFMDDVAEFIATENMDFSEATDVFRQQ